MEEIHGLHPLDADLEAFPRGASIAEQLRFLLRYAVLAPSEHNTQPWRFRVTKQSLEIHLDPARALPAIDPDQRALWLSCGAACFNLRLAMHYFGIQELLEVQPQPDHPTLAARLTVMLTECETPWEERQLFRAIPLRRSNRHQFTSKTIPLSLVASLITAAGNEGAWLSVVRKQEKRREIANLIMEAEGRLWTSDNFRAELSHWTRAHYAGERDGLPSHVGLAGDRMSATRTYEPSGQDEEEDLVLGAPLFTIMGTFGDAPVDWFIAGQAVERVLLYSCSEGVQCSFLNQPVAIPFIRSRLRATLQRSDYPQAVLRLGYGPLAPPTPRRQIADMLIDE